MINRWIEGIKDTPTRLAERREALTNRSKDLTEQARVRVRVAQGDGQERFWVFKTSTLERVGDLLGRGDEVPMIGRITGRAGKAVTSRLAHLTAVEIEDYDGLNAKKAIAGVRTLDSRVALAAVRRHEAANKNRKTVIAAIEGRIDALASRRLAA